jgi:hypothetical protein
MALAMGVSLACGDGAHGCTLVQCAGNGLQVPLVDASGQGVAAKGQYYTSAGGGSTHSFDCTGAASPKSYADCEDDRLQVGGLVQPGIEVQIHFQDAGGAWSEWLPVPLTLNPHPDPDFNGPGCPCTWYSATAEPLIVPAAWQWQR